MQGIFINGQRPKSKKAITEAVAACAIGTRVRLEATDMFGREYDGDVFAAPPCEYHFVGPDPFTSRKFYGSITVNHDRSVVKVK